MPPTPAAIKPAARSLETNEKLHPGLSSRTILILCTTIPIAIIFVITMGTVHIILKRHQAKLENKKIEEIGVHQPLPRPPARSRTHCPLEVDTAYPFGNGPGGSRRSPMVDSISPPSPIGGSPRRTGRAAGQSPLRRQAVHDGF